MTENLKTIADALKTISKVFYVITHPSIIWTWFMEISYWLSVLIICICIIYYGTSKSPKASRLIWLVIVIYCMLKGVDMVV